MIQIGTSGFSFEDWKGPVYPIQMKDRDMLAYYEKELGFHALEVNFTYYALPSQKSFVAMSKKTSPQFEFAVKAYKGMTHEIRNRNTGEMVDNQETFQKFKFSLTPLIDEGKLSCVLAQFPYGFFPKGENFRYLERFKEEMAEIPLVFEFRNQAWLRNGTFQFLEKQGVGYCVVDEPKLQKLMSIRYNYLYSEQELQEFIPDVQTISQKTSKTLVFFNNCYSGYAAKNAAQMAKLIAEQQS
jgi:uncharacterized protein YecE (DUF72 family)